jgi:hypothetical protein
MAAQLALHLGECRHHDVLFPGRELLGEEHLRHLLLIDAILLALDFTFVRGDDCLQSGSCRDVHAPCRVLFRAFLGTPSKYFSIVSAVAVNIR